MNIQCPNCFENFDTDLGMCPHCGYTAGEHAAEALHMDPGTLLENRYRIGRVLGYGGFGVTYLAWDMVLETKVAIKEYLPSEFSTRSVGVSQVTVYSGNKEQQFRDGMEKFVAEAKRLAKFQGEAGIVQIFDSFLANNTAYIVMEYLQGETLTAFLEREGTVSADAAIGLLTPVIKSLETVHAEGIIHRDIAPDNIMITTDGEVKLIDFGAARYATTSHSRSLTVIIKPGYSPEEQYRSRGDQGPHTDVYSAAAVLYRMITGVTPPDAMERRAFFENGKKDMLEAPSKYVKDLDTNLETALLNAMNVRIEDRTPDMGTFFEELTSEKPVKRRVGRIKKIDVLKWPLWAKIAVPTGLVAVVAVLALFFTGVIGFDSGLQKEITIPEGMSRVPSIVNDDLETADERLTSAILLYSIEGKEYSSLVSANLILTQDVAGGAVVVQNTVLNITVSGGAQTETVPLLLGISLAEAQGILKEVGFTVEVQESYSLSVAEGSIISQSEEAGTECEVGSVITLVVSKGVDPDAEVIEESTTVPDFVGMTYEEALEEAEKQGLMIMVVEQQYSSEYDEGIIMEQNLAVGEMVLKRSLVELVVSKGKETVKISDVQYQNEAEAKVALEKQGLTVNIVYEESNTVAEGLVISQSIDAGKTVDTGATITLTVSSGASSFEMPNVVGKAEADAKQTLSAKGLSVNVTYRYDTSVKEGIVLEQNISAGENVKRGDKVTLVVSSGEEVITVEDVTGKTQDDAKKTLTRQGFTVSVTEVYDESVSAGIVMSQTPAAGSGQKKNTQIVLTVSKGKEEITSISVASKPNKTVYYVGDTYSATGLALTATYNSGKTASISSGYSCDNTSLTKAGTQTITVSYAGKTTSFDITVNEVILESIAIKSSPSKTSYFIDETLSTSGLTLTATYNSGKSETIMSGFTCSPTTFSSAGTQNITVSYGGKTTSFSVTVSDVSVTSISIATKPDTTSYYEGDVLDTTGLTLKASYSDGSSGTVSSGFTCSPLALSTAGAQTITVTYGGKTASFSVTVKENSLTSISIKQEPTTTSYYVGDTLDTTGLRLTATYASGKTETVLSGYTCSPTTLSTSGTQKVTVTYGGKTTSFSVTVKALSVSSISVKSNPTKTSYYIGDSLDTTGLKLTVVYNNSSTATIDSSFTCSPTTFSTAGTQTITVTYEGKTATFTVSVTAVTLSSISVKSKPTTTSYYVGDTLSTSGLTLTAAYNNGTTATITSGFTCSPTTLSTAGTQTVTVTYGGKTTSFTVSVIEVALSSISVKTSPNTTSYYVGDTLDTSGLTLTATYNNGDTETISSGFTCSPTSLSTAGTQTITVTYSGKTTSFTVSVTTPSISISNSSLSLTEGNSSTLTATVVPSSSTVKWASSNTSVATVSSGKVTAVAEGSSTVTASITYGGNTYSATCDVTVSKEYVTVTFDPDGGTVSPTSIKVEKGGTVELPTPTPQYEDDEFDGWYTAYVGGTKYTNSTVITSDVTLYAMWVQTIKITGTGSCGDNLTWKYDGDGNLTISGTGDMNAYSSSSDIPWYSYRNYIKNIIIGEGVTGISKYAFDSCENLNNVSIPDSVTYIGPYAFKSCNGLTEVVIPNSVTSIGVGAFMYCKGLINVVLPDNITDIANSLFNGCTSLLNVNIPNDVTTIGVLAFASCIAITSIDLPDSVISIRSSAFSGCSSLTCINIPSSVTSIEGVAFGYCKALSEIIIPENVITMGSKVFVNWTSSQTIYIEGYTETPSGWDSDWAENCEATIVWGQ